MSVPNLVLVELNEATDYFIDKFASNGLLPNISRMVEEGSRLQTTIPDQDTSHPRFRRNISPWIIWPSIYTGMMPDDHDLVAFGQDTSHLRGKYVWDLLAEHGVEYGILGSLLSSPPRSNSRFYFPEALSEFPECHPSDYASLQKFVHLAAHNYSGNFVGMAAQALILLLGSMRAGVQASTVFRTLMQLPRELIQGAAQTPERAMLYSYITHDAFGQLYRQCRPQFATVHYNHIAYMQHRFWRAAEPERFSSELSSTDRRFFETATERDQAEAAYSHRIEQSYAWTDRMVGDLMGMMSQGSTLVLTSALSQRPYDPVSEVHNPVVRLSKAESLFELLGLSHYAVHYEMNPDLTINFASSGQAEDAMSIIGGLYAEPARPLFAVTHRGHQLFLELDVPPLLQENPNALIRHERIDSVAVPGAQFIWQAPSNEQSTAHHDEHGVFLAWRKGEPTPVMPPSISVTDIAPAVLQYFGVEPAPWHRANPELKLR